MGNEWTLGEKQNSLKKEKEYAVIVGLITPGTTVEQNSEYLDELEFLALTAGAHTKKRFTQKLSHPDKRYFVGKGKMQEIQEYVEQHEEINMVIFDDDLNGKQVGILEEELKVKIIDRSSLILDIFANRAQTAQAKTQVELAQMQYMLPRLRGLWTHLERQRNRGEMIRVALVGYTNVGKSTLMNILSKSDVFAENKLFATLDTTVRKIVLDRMPFLLSDTVGFIRKLPHHLIESFKSTLDEVREADLILHVVDMAHPQYEDHIAAVNRTLKDLDAMTKPTLMVFNKLDLYRERYFDAYLDEQTKKEILAELRENLVNNYTHDAIFISAFKKENINALREEIKKKVAVQYEERYPYHTKTW